jgi:hypothetical protein
MAHHRKGTASRNRGCGLCKPWRKAGNGGRKDADSRRDPLVLYERIGHHLAPGAWRDDRSGEA